MQSKYLRAIYRYVYDADFNSERKSDRVMMQRVVYLLEEYGVFLGYSFGWNEPIGPYSYDLDEDMHCTLPEEDDITFAPNTLAGIKCVKELVRSNTEYSLSNWTECLVVLLYLRTKVMSAYLCDSIVCNEMFCKRRHLNKFHINELAMRQLREVYEFNALGVPSDRI